MCQRSHAAWSGLSAGFWWATNVTVAASPCGPVTDSPVSLALRVPRGLVGGAEIVQADANGRDEQAAVRLEIVPVDGREVAVQQHHDPVHMRLDGRARGDRHGVAGGR